MIVLKYTSSYAYINAHTRTRIHTHSWSFLEIHNAEEIPEYELAHLAGVMEGKLTGDLILMQWKNTLGNFCSTPSAFCTKLQDFLYNNQLFLNDQMKKETDSPYWLQVS